MGTKSNKMLVFIICNFKNEADLFYTPLASHQQQTFGSQCVLKISPILTTDTINILNYVALYGKFVNIFHVITLSSRS